MSNEVSRIRRCIALADAMGHPWVASDGRRKLKRLLAQATATCEDCAYCGLHHSAHENGLPNECPLCGHALATGSRRAKTPQAVECEASQSGPKGNAPEQSA